MRNADHLDPELIRRLLPEPEFVEALGVLEMIARTPEQQMRYDARRKFQMDEAARLEYAKEQGRTEGRREGEQIGQVRGEQIGQARGEQIGQIRLLEQILGLPQTTSEALAKLGSDELAATTNDLRRQLRERSV